MLARVGVQGKLQTVERFASPVLFEADMIGGGPLGGGSITDWEETAAERTKSPCVIDETRTFLSTFTDVWRDAREALDGGGASPGAPPAAK